MDNEALRIGSLCAGYGGLDIAVLAVFGGRLAWCADNDKHTSVVLLSGIPMYRTLKVDTELMARDFEIEMHVVEAAMAGCMCLIRGCESSASARFSMWQEFQG